MSFHGFLASLALAAPLAPAQASASGPAAQPAAAAQPDDPSALLPAPAPFQSQVDDPLLTPVAPPAQLVGGWNEALKFLRERSTDERSAAAGLERAEARWRQALGALMPQVRFSAGVGIDLLHPTVAPSGAVPGGAAVPTQERTPTSPLLGASVSATQPLFDLGAKRGIDAAAAAQRGAQASLKDVQRRLTQGLARALVAVVAAERVAELNRLGLRQALERAALTQRTKELGAATQLDLVRVTQDVELARGAVVAGDEQLRRTRDALGLALGFDHDLGVPAGFKLQELVDETRAQCAALPKLEERPDLVAAREQVKAAEESTRQAAAGALPTVGLQSSIWGYTTTPLPGRVANWNLAAVLSVPLWEGGTRKALVDERTGAEVQAREALERSRREVSLEVARSRRGVDVAERLLTTAKDARALAERTDELTRRSFEVGRANSLELVQSAAALRQADVTLATREFEWVQARLDAFLTEATCDW